MNILKISLVLLMIIVLSGCASKFRPGMGSYGDAASTIVNLESGDFVEANPVFSSIDSPIGVGVASIGMKWGGKHVLHDGLGVDAYTSDTLVESAGMAATGWNFALLLGGGNPVSALAAIGAAWIYYEYRDNNREHERYEYLYE